MPLKSLSMRFLSSASNAGVAVALNGPKLGTTLPGAALPDADALAEVAPDADAVAVVAAAADADALVVALAAADAVADVAGVGVDLLSSEHATATTASTNEAVRAAN
jgi:hypothetical protein